MKVNPSIDENFDGRTSLPARIDHIFQPSVAEIVKHMARVLAEQDYKYYLSTGECPPITLTAQGGADD